MTLDLTVLEMGPKIKIRAASTNPNLGGQLFTDKLIHFLIENFASETGINLREENLHTQALQRIFTAAEVAKCELSTGLVNEVNLPFIAADAAGPKNLIVKISRAKLEDLVHPLVTESLEDVQQFLSRNGLEVKDIDEFIVVGGQSKMPLVVEELEEYFSKKAYKDNAVSADEAVVLGLTLFEGGVQEVKDVGHTYSRNPLDIGIEINGGVTHVLIPRGSSLPARTTQIFTTVADRQREIELRLVQGSNYLASENRTIGLLSLSELPDTLKAELLVEVTVEINEHGDVTATAQEKITESSSTPVMLKTFGGLTKEMIRGLREKARKEDRSQLVTWGNKMTCISNQLQNLKALACGTKFLIGEVNRSDHPPLRTPPPF
eukprot:TRINITY_DN1353_c0_g1_i9.p1 TRINITY_DN1353_c0_g1~~TRINITY_DN1353_c0_g1_i9.p1  ORF type:complete len:377 (-),score=72.01 TRINITY_DN1353_c0_g1_i9:1324-2454(-)